MPSYKVGGFTFSDEISAKNASKEMRAVEYLLKQLSNADEAEVLNIYNQLLDKHIFNTEVGLSFLNQLRANLIDSQTYSEKDIRPVYAVDMTSSQQEMAKTPDAVESSYDTSDGSSEDNEDVSEEESVEVFSTDAKKQIRRLKRINRLLLVLCITLTLVVIGMFYISTTINSPNILNYEEKIINKYSDWEQDLTQRENALREREQNN